MPELNSKFIKGCNKPGRYYDTGRIGLMLWVKPRRKNGEIVGLYKYWIQRLRVAGKKMDRSLGKWPDLDLRGARLMAAKNYQTARKGIDPTGKMQSSGDDGTFEWLARRRHAELLPGFKNKKHGQQWINTLTTYAFPTIGKMPVGEIEPEHIMALLLEGGFWQEKPETARRVLQRISAVMRYARICKYRKDDPTQDLNEILPKQAKKPVPMPSLHWQEVPEAIATVRSMSKRAWPPARLALEFLALTAARPGEVRHAAWDHVDTSAAIWVVPAELTKMGREHIVPLSDRCIEILNESERFAGDSGLIFPNRGQGPLSDMTLLKVMRDLEIDAVPHGFRSSFRVWTQEQQTASFEVAESALAHAPPSKTIAAYARSDHLEIRRPLMQKWADHVCGKERGKVVRLTHRA